nr:unnamed protein product [Digitaria exilis]
MATGLTKAMKGSLCHEYETELPASDVWEVYRGLLAGQLVPQLVPEVHPKVELVEGDGGAGTVLLVSFPPVANEYKNNPPVASTSGLASIAEAIAKYAKEKRAQAMGQLSEE